MTIEQIACNAGNHGGSRRADQIRYLVYHYTANRGDTAENNAKYFARTVTKSSAHYFVDRSHIVQSVPDLTVAWAVGGALQGSGGGTMHGIVTNTNSLSIEMCDSYDAVPEETAELAAELGRKLMAKYNIPLDRVYRHYDVTGKICPRPLVDKAAWAKFKERLEEDTVTYEQWKEFMDQYRKELSAKAPANYAKEALAEATEEGITDGTRPADLITRQETVTMIMRATDKV